MGRDIYSANDINTFVKALERLFLVSKKHSTTIYLVRHGQAELPKVDNKYNPPLSRKGLAQADQLGKRLVDYGIKHLFAGPSLRTRQTADVINKHLGLAIQILPELDEIRPTHDFNKLAKGMSEVAHKLGGIGTSESRKRFVQAIWDGTPGIETKEAFRTRAVSVINEIIREYSGQNVLLVTHFGFINAYIGELLGLFGDAFFFANETSLNEVKAFGERRVLARLNDSAHLAGII